MILIDVNVLIYALRRDMPNHDKYHAWLEDVVNAQDMFGVSELTLSSVIRVVTHPNIYKEPSALKDVLAFIEEIRRSPSCVFVGPGDRHWSIFLSLIKTLKLTGNAIPDAYLAALAIEWGYELVTTDKGFARFELLKWRHPLSG